MNLHERIAQWFRVPAPAPPPAGQPAQVYINQTPARSSTSRKTVLAAVGLFAGAAWLCSAVLRRTEPASVPVADLGVAGVDKGRIQRIIDDLNKKNAELTLRRAEAEQRQIQDEPKPGLWNQQTAAPAPARSLAEERRERAYKSLFASPVVAVRAEEVREEPALAASAVAPAATPASSPAAEKTTQPMPGAAPADRDCVDLDGSDRRLYALCEGTIIEARLENRLVGDFSGPVNALVERDQYSRDRQHLLIPKGTKLLGTAAMAARAFQERLAVEFHRMLLPDGRGVDLRHAVGLDQAGAVALKDQVHRHIPSMVLATVALGGLAGFAQMGTGNYLNGDGLDLYRQSLASQAGQTGQQLIGRNLNRPPSITIREGHPVEIYLNTDLHLPEYQPVISTGFGGTQK